MTRAWEQELNCEGFYGFGGGYAQARGYRFEGGLIYCNRCPLREPCWFRHRGRVMFLLPALTAKFLDHVNAHRMMNPQATQAGMKAWFEEVGTSDPFSSVLGGNIEDGAAVALAGSPKDRGPFTLPWPLVRALP